MTLYVPESPLPVYCLSCFWADSWEALDYGLNYDANRPFVEQLFDLYQRVPRLSVMNQFAQNSEYCNYSYSNKNCYLVFSSHYEEDCFYGNCSTKNKSCVDYHWLGRSELCYESMFSADCYRCAYVDHCHGCSDCYFCVDLKGCSNCLFCANLRQKHYHIFNKAYSKDEYERLLADYNLQSYQGFCEAKQIFFGKLRTEFPFRAVHQVQCENCEGSNHLRCKNLVRCFEANDSEDVINGTYLAETYDSIDVNYTGWDRCELCCECIGITDLFNGICCDSCWHGGENLYCSYCSSCRNCFGCLSLKQKQYCILNKQYSKEVYEALVPKIIASMRECGDWGRFFSPSFSPFSYDETVANDWYPLSKDEAKRLGFFWQSAGLKNAEPQTCKLSDRIDDAADSISEERLACISCSKNYKIVSAELQLYRDMQVPLPRTCPDCRQHERLKLHSPWRVWQRDCAMCSCSTQSIFAPERPEKVFCESCYLKAVY